MDDHTTIGARLRVLRRWRGMTLTEVAGLAGVTGAWLSMVERGLRPLDRRSHIAAIASALRVSEADLVGGPHLSADPVQAEPHAHIPALRVALGTNSLTESIIEDARPVSELAAEVRNSIEPLRRACDYPAIGARLPNVLDELYCNAAGPADERAHQLALRTLVEACVCACFTAKDLGYDDLAQVAALRATEAAEVLDDPIALGKAAFLRIHTIPKAGSWERAFITAKRSADRLESRVADDLGVEVLGLLVLSTSLAAASLRKNAEAQTWLHEAESLAQRVPDDPDRNWQSFSATNVNVWQVTVGVELGQAGGAVLELANRVNEQKLSGTSSRHADYLADVGRGLARDSKMRRDAVTWLQRAERVAPARIRNSVPAKESVAVMLEQARSAAGGRELRGMAARMGIPH